VDHGQANEEGTVIHLPVKDVLVEHNHTEAQKDLDAHIGVAQHDLCGFLEITSFWRCPRNEASSPGFETGYLNPLAGI
jgi:hypothetical protein